MTEPNFLDILRERGGGALDKKMGIEILEASPERLVGRMPVEGNTQPFGLLHGGANVVLAESLGSVGTINLLRQDLLQVLQQQSRWEKLCASMKS